MSSEIGPFIATTVLLTCVPAGLLWFALRRRERPAIWLAAASLVMITAAQLLIVWIRWRFEITEQHADLGAATGGLVAVVLLLLGTATVVGAGLGLAIAAWSKRAASNQRDDARLASSTKSFKREGNRHG